jgi:DNA polymerase-1
VKLNSGHVIITTQEEFLEALKDISTAEWVVLDTETQGLDVWNGHLQCGVGVLSSRGSGYYFPFRHKDEDLPLLAPTFSGDLNLSLTKDLPRLLKTLNKPKLVIGHNLKFDLAVLYQDGFEIAEHQEIQDTITAARMYFADKYQSLGLEAVSDILLATDTENWKRDFKTYFKKHKYKTYDEPPPEIVGDYCINDCINTRKIYDILLRHIDKTDQRRVWQQESELLKVLWGMEKEGLYFDREYCLDRIEKLHNKLSDLERTIYELVGREFDIRSPKQVNEVMQGLGIQSPHLTLNGAPKWGVAELMAVSHPVAALILEYRGIEKMRSTYFEPLPSWVDDRLHPNFKPWGAVTGRMSCTNPSLMNLSKKSQNLAGEDDQSEAIEAIKAMLGARTGQIVDMTSASGNLSGGGSYAGLISYAKKYDESEYSVSVRRLYTPPPGFSLYAIDFSQMEMRVFADYVDDPQLFELLERTDFDFHSHVATQVWNVEEDSTMWKFYRNLAKAINFGLIYGIGTDKLGSQIQKTKDEAVEYKKQYFARFPKAEKFIWKVRDRVVERGYVVNRFGRRYYIEKDKAYVGVNYLVQGTSADIVKNRMVAIFNYLKDKKTRMVVQVHDELVFYVHESEERWIVPVVQKMLEERQIKTYLPTEVVKGDPSWGQVKDICMKHIEFKEICSCSVA